MGTNNASIEKKYNLKNIIIIIDVLRLLIYKKPLDLVCQCCVNTFLLVLLGVTKLY